MADNHQQPSSDDAGAPADPKPIGGRRSQIYLLLTAIVVIALVVSLLTRSDDDGNSSEAMLTQLITTDAQGLSGLIPADAFARSTCGDEDGGRFACSVDARDAIGVKGAKRAPLLLRVGDGRLLKYMGVTAAPTTGDEAAQVLVEDDADRLGLANEYACAYGVGLNPDGSRADNSANGYRCFQTKGAGAAKGDEEPLQRYVEYTDDGWAARDFVVAAAGGASDPAAGPR